MILKKKTYSDQEISYNIPNMICFLQCLEYCQKLILNRKCLQQSLNLYIDIYAINNINCIYIYMHTHIYTHTHTHIYIYIYFYQTLNCYSNSTLIIYLFLTMVHSLVCYCLFLVRQSGTANVYK